MTQEAATPAGFWERVEQVCERVLARYIRSGALRNSSLTGGSLTLRGGVFRMVNVADTFNQFYLGPVTPAQPDGTLQPGWILRRADGSLALSVYDAFPADGPDGVQQAVNWWDRSGQIVVADDTDSGQGLARPFLGGNFGRARYADMGVQTTSGSFETLWIARLTKQQPKLMVTYRATMDTAGTTGETRVLVDGVPLGPAESQEFVIGTYFVGPAAVAGAHMSTITVEIQGRRTSASGALRVEALNWEGRQS